MSLIGSIAIAMQVQTEELTKGVKVANNALDTMGKKLEAVEGVFKGTVAAVGGFFATKALISATQSASDLADEAGRMEDTFGGASRVITSEADKMATAFGTSRTEFIKSATDIGQAFENIGYSARDAAKLSVHYTRMAQDAAARYGGSAADAMTKIKSAVSGSADAMKEWGVDLSDVNLRLKAQAMGMEGLTDKLTPAQAAMARVALIEEKMVGAQGALAKGTFAASSATLALKGRFDDLMATIGEGFLPLVSSAMSELQLGVEVLSQLWADTGAGIVSDLTGVIGATDATTTASSKLEAGIIGIARAWQFAKIGFAAAQSTITWALAQTAKGLGVVEEKIAELVGKIPGVTVKGTSFFKVYGEDLERLAGEQFDNLVTKMGEAPAGAGVHTAFEAARKRIAESRKLVGAAGPDVTKLRPKEGPTPTVAPKFASVAAYGSQAAANLILQSRYGAGGGKDAAGKTADNTGKLVNQAMIQTGLFSKLVAKLSPVKPTEFDDPLARAMMGGF